MATAFLLFKRRKPCYTEYIGAKEEKAVRFRKPKGPQYDPEKQCPAIRSSICTGEKTAGFFDLATGRFLEVMLIRTQDDLNAFRAQYGIEGPIKTIY